MEKQGKEMMPATKIKDRNNVTKLTNVTHNSKWLRTKYNTEQMK